MGVQNTHPLCYFSRLDTFEVSNFHLRCPFITSFPGHKFDKKPHQLPLVETATFTWEKKPNIYKHWSSPVRNRIKCCSSLDKSVGMTCSLCSLYFWYRKYKGTRAQIRIKDNDCVWDRKRDNQTLWNLRAVQFPLDTLFYVSCSSSTLLASLNLQMFQHSTVSLHNQFCGAIHLIDQRRHDTLINHMQRRFDVIKRALCTVY